MKRNAFTMIELIFVIVILGILASVAIPKLAGVQDDALEATERAAISSARTGVQALHGKRVIRGAASIKVSLTDNKGAAHTVYFDANSTTAAGTTSTFSNQGYPFGLSIAGTPGTADTNATAVVAASGAQLPLIIVLEMDNPAQWSTEADTNASISVINGPASTTVDAASDATITSANYWQYSPESGQFLLK